MTSIDEKLQKHAQNRTLAKSVGAADVAGGVTVTFLMEVFGMDRRDVNRRLKDCPVMGSRHKDTKRNLYDLATAAQYLVKPVFNPEEYLKTMRPSELPAHLQDSFWSAMNKRQKWEENAAELWRTEDVMVLFGEVFLLIKGTMQLWAENMQRSTGLGAEQKKFLQASVDGLQKEIHEKLVGMHDKTKPQTAELPALIAAAGPSDEETKEDNKEGQFDDLI